MPDAGDVIDAPALTAAIQRCFALSMDSSVPAHAQAELMSAAKRLRGYLLNLVSARFAARTPEVRAANLAITAANDALAADMKKVKRVAEAVSKLAALLKKLDAALVAAAGFA
jgi:hypothetical protein